jgi:hypothetical protein
MAGSPFTGSVMARERKSRRRVPDEAEKDREPAHIATQKDRENALPSPIAVIGRPRLDAN